MILGAALPPDNVTVPRYRLESDGTAGGATFILCL
jgi:hypothetical protein